MAIGAGAPGRTLIVIGCVAWMLAPAGIVTALSLRASAIQLAPAVTVWAPVEANAGQLSEPVDLTLTWQQLPPLVAPAWQGTVQAVGLVPGSRLESGQVIAVVDGISRIGWASGRPFYRPLGIGDVGADAAELNAMLAGMGLTAGDGDEVTYATRSGIRELAVSIGVPDGHWATQFEPGWIVYLPAASVDVGAVELVVGAPAPGAGGTLGELDARLASAVLTVPGADGVSAGGEDDGGGEPRHPVVADPGEVLMLAGSELELTPELDRVSSAALDAASALVADGAETVGARLSRPPGRAEWVVPAAAVFAGSEGRACVVSGTDDHPVIVPVTAMGSELGRAIVAGDLTSDDRVAVRPAAELRRCE
jgi:hypothetical protein